MEFRTWAYYPLIFSLHKKIKFVIVFDKNVGSSFLFRTYMNPITPSDQTSRYPARYNNNKLIWTAYIIRWGASNEYILNNLEVGSFANTL